MPVLRIKPDSTGNDKCELEVILEDTGAPLAATVDFSPGMTAQDHEDLRWYLEDYLSFAEEPAPRIADRVEARMRQLGASLFSDLFDSTAGGRAIWNSVRGKVDQLRVEVLSVRGTSWIPWELLREPGSTLPLALLARSFSRIHPDIHPAKPAAAQSLRVLLVICRPGGAADVPFRSVARHLVSGLGREPRSAVRFDVLRPPCYDSLEEALGTACRDGAPYHVVHFDGHGAYLDAFRTGRRRGYLVFETPSNPPSEDYIHGVLLGRLLARYKVPLLVLNACRSAHAEPTAAPGKGESDESARAFGSLAEEAIQAGLIGVVAMRYNIYVVRAARFMRVLYSGLAQACSLSEAVTLARNELAQQPDGLPGAGAVPLQDWCVPVVYEAAEQLCITIPNVSAAGVPAVDRPTGGLPPQPLIGFIGRDDAILAVDRAFDCSGAVLLHAPAGSGKTTVAIEFARWYLETGGRFGGLALFSSLEFHTPLRHILDDLERSALLAVPKEMTDWSVLTEGERREEALRLMQRVPILWIWDNVESVAGFPEGEASPWSDSERRELSKFLADAVEVGAKLLLTSRRSEQLWLGNLPVRVQLQPMPLLDSLQFAHALADRVGRPLGDIRVWLPLLRFSQGNPLALTAGLSQALREGLGTRAGVESFIVRLATGEELLDDSQAEGRSRSLSAVLSYGLEHGFTVEEQKALALLRFFRGNVSAMILGSMGEGEPEQLVEEVKNWTRARRIALLDRAAELGFLQPLGRGRYAIHPVLPWFLARLYERHYGADSKPVRAFTEAMGTFSNVLYSRYLKGETGDEVMQLGSIHFENVLRARELARSNAWGRAYRRCMRWLRIELEHRKEFGLWKQFLSELESDVTDPITGEARTGREDEWAMFLELKGRDLRREKNWVEAERVQRKVLELDRMAYNATIKQGDASPDVVRQVTENLAQGLRDLGHVLIQVESVEAAAVFTEALDLYRLSSNEVAQAYTLASLADVYADIPSLEDLSLAKQCCREALLKITPTDPQGLTLVHYRLGNLAWRQAIAAVKSRDHDTVFQGHVKEALCHFLAARRSLPEYMDHLVGELHEKLANAYSHLGDQEKAFALFRLAIRDHERDGDQGDAAWARLTFAMALSNANRLTEAEDYALAAGRYYAVSNAEGEEARTVQAILDVIAKKKRA